MKEVRVLPLMYQRMRRRFIIKKDAKERKTGTTKRTLLFNIG